MNSGSTMIRRRLSAIFLLFVATASVRSQSHPDTVMYHIPLITVVGTRFSEPWIQIPFSLNYVSNRDIPRGKGYGLDEVLSAIPGVLTQSRYGNQDVRLTIRGYGARGAGERSNAGTTRSVRILNNGFAETEPDGRTSLDLIDLTGAGGIEVMRSNASSIYGNASGGVVSIIANTGFSLPYMSYTQSFGDFGFHKELVNVGALLQEGRFYLSLGNTNSDGWRWHSQSSQALLNTGIVIPTGERTTLGVHVAATNNIFRIPGPLSKGQYDSLAQQADSLYIKRDERRYNRLGRLGITLTHQLNNENTIHTSAYVQPKLLQRSERGTFRNFTRYHVGGSVLFRNQSSFGGSLRNSFMVGVNEAYQDGAILFYNLTSESGRGTLRDNKREGANSFGAFAQNELEFGDWFVLAGLRYDNITYSYDNFINPKLNESKSFTGVTPTFGLTYRFSPTHSVHVNLGGGIEVPAGNETDPAGTYGLDTIYAINPFLEPMRSTTAEIGTKQVMTTAAGDAVSSFTYDVALYWLQIRNDIIPYRGGRFYFTAGKTERVGCEVGGVLTFALGLQAYFALTVSRNTYKEYRVDSVHYSAAKAGLYADFAGNKQPGIPDFYFNLGLKYKPGALEGVYVRLDMQNTQRYFVDDANTIEVPGSTVLNAGMGVDRYTFAGDRFFIGGFVGVNNLTDIKYIGSAWLNPDIVAGRPVYVESGLPRNFVVSVWLGVNLL